MCFSAQDRDGLLERVTRTRTVAPFLEQATIATPIAAVVGAKPHQVAKDRDRLGRLASCFQEMAQGVRRLGSQGAGDRVIPDGFVST